MRHVVMEKSIGELMVREMRTRPKMSSGDYIHINVSSMIQASLHVVVSEPLVCHKTCQCQWDTSLHLVSVSHWIKSLHMVVVSEPLVCCKISGTSEKSSCVLLVSHWAKRSLVVVSATSVRCCYTDASEIQHPLRWVAHWIKPSRVVIDNHNFSISDTRWCQ
jgi:hypothetical protein